MAGIPEHFAHLRAQGFLRRLVHDRAGNTLALIAAALLPLLGLVGSGIDMGRAYLAAGGLQSACDAGVLAARKNLGTGAAANGNVPDNVATIGQRFFNLNFRSGSFGTENRQFTMTLEEDFAISGHAEVDVPTSIMTVFGFEKVPISVDCSAVLSIADLDVMMVLDVTGSMRHTNEGDDLSRIESLKEVIRNFHAQLEGSKGPESTIRYGFVPYATKVNVGHLLEDEWVVDEWTYQSRESDGTNQTVVNYTFYQNHVVQSGTAGPYVDESSYAATFHPGTPPPGGTGDNSPVGTSGYFTCDGSTPASSYTITEVVTNTETEQVTDPDGTRTTQFIDRTQNGTTYYTSRSGTICTVKSRTYTDYFSTFERVTEPRYRNTPSYTYRPITKDVSNWRSETGGCIEERQTYEISNFDAVDLTSALDLNIDLVPSSADPDTQWRPGYPADIYARSFNTAGTGSFTPAPVTTSAEFAATGNWWFSHCPSGAQKLKEMTAEEVDTYLGTLAPFGATYHDIGMIWGARLISPTGIFAAENADDGDTPRSRHMVFLTDGQTEAYDLAYSSYGIEGLDERRWNSTSTMTLAETVEARFGVACAEAKKRNINVWVIAFGTYLNDSMLQCAGEGRYFEASSAEELNNAFTSIADSIGDLRIDI